MAQNVIYVKAKKQAVLNGLKKLPAMMAGNVSEVENAAKAVLVRVGLTALARIRDAFVVKAKGGTDDCGLSWPPLKPSTIAYSRRHPGVPRPDVRAGFAPSWMLTQKQRERWWKLYRHGLEMFRGEKTHAARRAWAIIKGEGAKTLIGEYGNTPVEILRDTGLLLNSLSPGVAVDATTITNVANQVFRIGKGEVVVGTNRKWAWVHHQGTSRIPQRRLWAPPSKWPKPWWDDMLAALREGLIDVTIYMMTRNS